MKGYDQIKEKKRIRKLIGKITLVAFIVISSFPPQDFCKATCPLSNCVKLFCILRIMHAIYMQQRETKTIQIWANSGNVT